MRCNKGPCLFIRVANPTVSRQADRQQAGRQAGIRFGSKSNREQADSSWRLDGGP
eukprot:SAG25_NODE_14856_length_221_cov_38.106557_1_plen_54_part_10